MPVQYHKSKKKKVEQSLYKPSLRNPCQRISTMSRSTIFAILVAFAMIALSTAFTATSITLRGSAASSRCISLKMSAADDEKARREAAAAAKPRPPAQNDYLSQMSKPRAPVDSSAADDEKARREAAAASKPRPPAQNDYLSTL